MANSIRKTPLEDIYFSIGKMTAIVAIMLLLAGYFLNIVYVLNFLVSMAFTFSFAVSLFVLYKCLQYIDAKWMSYVVVSLIGLLLIEAMLSFLSLIAITRDNISFLNELSTRIYPIISSAISVLYLIISVLLFLNNKRGGHFIFLAIAFLISAFSGVAILLVNLSIDVSIATNVEREKANIINYLISASTGILLLIALLYTFIKEDKLQRLAFISSFEEKNDYRIF